MSSICPQANCKTSGSVPHISKKTSDSGTDSQTFSTEEFKLLKLQDSIPQAFDTLINIQRLKKGDSDSIIELIKSANLGCTTSQFYLGQAYEHGHIVDMNNKEAFAYYSHSADSGHLEAKFNLGVFYINGNGCEQYVEKGHKLIKDAAEEGLAEAKIALGKSEKIIINEDDLDLKEGEELFHMGQIMAENELNDSEDQIFALELYRVAAESGHPLAEEKYLELFEKISKELAFECEMLLIMS